MKTDRDMDIAVLEVILKNDELEKQILKDMAGNRYQAEEVEGNELAREVGEVL